MSLEEISAQLDGDDPETRLDGVEALATLASDRSFDPADGETEPFDLAIEAATDDDSAVAYNGTKALSRLVRDGAATAALMTVIPADADRTYAERIAEVATERIDESNPGRVRSRGALVISRLASNDVNSVVTEAVVERLLDLLQTGQKAIRKRRAALALTNLGHYDHEGRAFVRAEMATAADSLRELASADDDLLQSVGLRALGFMGLSEPEAALPATELHAAVVDRENRPRNVNRAVRSLWQIGRTHPSVVVPVRDELETLLSYTETDAEDAAHLPKDTGALAKHARYVRSNAAMALAQLARSHPEQISEAAVERCVDLLEQRDESIHRVVRLLGQVHETHGDALDTADTTEEVRSYLAAERESKTATKRHTKARGYAVWLLTRLSSDEPLPESAVATALDYLTAVPTGERTAFGPLRTEALATMSRAFPEQVTAHDESVDWLCRRAGESATSTERADAVTGLLSLVRSETTTPEHVTSVLEERLGAESAPRVRRLLAEALGVVSTPSARRVLAETAVTESRPDVSTAIDAALEHSGPSTETHAGKDHPLAPTALPVVSATAYTPWLTETIEYGDIEVHHRIQHGGTGTVHRASLHPPAKASAEAPRTIALKRPLEPAGRTVADLSEYIGEAEKWARVHDHPNIVTIFSWGAQPQPWIAMEYLDEGELGEFAEARSLPVSQGLWIGVCIADALQHAHSHGIYHRDITPANVLLQRRRGWPMPKLADWGTARKRHELSRGDEAYTPGYGAPEQRPESEWAREVPPAKTDIYQLATLVYELLTGEQPFAVEQAVQKRERAPAPPGDVRDGVPPAVDDLLRSALRPDPAARPETAARVRDVLADQW